MPSSSVPSSPALSASAAGAAPARQKADVEKLQAFVGRVVGDFGAALSSGLVYIGQELGLYRAMAGGEPISPEALAERTETHPRYIREWLLNQAASGYVEYDPQTGRYRLSPEQAVALTDEASPFFVGGGFYVIKAMLMAQGRIARAFRTGEGMRWGDHDPDLFIGTERFFRPGYAAHLTSSWIPALTGIEQQLKAGVKVADVGCGRGASTMVMAQAYPKSQFFGYDTHEPSIRYAQQQAFDADLERRAAFAVEDASRIPDQQYALICFFDCLHDMGDPVGAMRRAAQTLSPEGSVLIVEPMAGERVEDNFTPLGRTFSAASTLCCTANSLAFNGPALGAVATEEALRKTATEGGFTEFRLATTTPFNRVFEARRPG